MPRAHLSRIIRIAQHLHPATGPPPQAARCAFGAANGVGSLEALQKFQPPAFRRFRPGAGFGREAAMTAKKSRTSASTRAAVGGGVGRMMASVTSSLHAPAIVIAVRLKSRRATLPWSARAWAWASMTDAIS